MESSRVKYRLSLEAANATVSEEDKVKGTYTDEALDKVAELHFLLKGAAEEFKTSLRSVEAAFADEYGRRDRLDSIQDRVPGMTKRGCIKIKGKIWDANDYGLSNVDLNTAKRIMLKYNIEIPQGKDLEDYLCTDKGCARFTAAAIREAQDELNGYIRTLPVDKRAIMESLNRDEMDALLVTIYKRGMEKERTVLDEQLSAMLKSGKMRKYLYIGEGYKAWRLWINRESWK